MATLQSISTKSYDRVRGAAKRVVEDRRTNHRDTTGGYLKNGARQQGRILLEPCGASMGMKPGTCTTVL